MTRRHAITSASYMSLAVIAAGTFVLPDRLTVPVALAGASTGIRLTGTIRDFTTSHVDFGITDPTMMGHTTGNVGPALPAHGRPLYGGGGTLIVTQWYDRDGNPITPYAGDGLPGGHFDVDVFDEATDAELYHMHQFDDEFNLTYVDIFNDTNLLFDAVIGASYPNDLRVEFDNEHNGGGGFYVFEAASTYAIGATADGFTATFDPGSLTQLRVDFLSLGSMRGTSPSTVHSDVPDRDDAFSVRMYDDVTGDLVYELAVYMHGTFIPGGGGGGIGMPGDDACGVAFGDIPGIFGVAGGGAVSDSDSFGQWFRDVLGTNFSKAHTITLEDDGTGIFSYLDDYFYPLDGQLFGNEGELHNNLFTYSISASFTYRECLGQFFEFEGTDDCWVFIDGERVIDLGGVNTLQLQRIGLDRLGLVDGNAYELDFFYAHRHVGDSVFRMRTNIPLGTDDWVTTSAGYD